MSNKLRLYVMVGAAAVFALAVLMAAAYWACQQGPAFYQQVLAEGPASAKHASDALLHEAAALANNLRRAGQWHALFTADQINGWLAYDVLQNHPRLFPPSISEPRISIENNRAQIAFVWHKLGWAAIVSLEAEVYLRETNVVAVRICKARAGLLPLPLGGLVNDFITAGQEVGLQIDVAQIDGDPLLTITMPWADHSSDQFMQRLESLEVNEGEIYMAGHCQNAQAVGSVAQQPAAALESSDQQPVSQESSAQEPSGQKTATPEPTANIQQNSSAEVQTEKLNIHR
ncbi:MAG TPA: hypothetical protein VMJ32_11155 [Pirellulales bacterium]|nr:hypothetical protein [Pirellulales bacterium]